MATVVRAEHRPSRLPFVYRALLCSGASVRLKIACVAGVSGGTEGGAEEPEDLEESPTQPLSVTEYAREVFDLQTVRGAPVGEEDRRGVHVSELYSVLYDLGATAPSLRPTHS